MRLLLHLPLLLCIILNQHALSQSYRVELRLSNLQTAENDRKGIYNHSFDAKCNSYAEFDLFNINGTKLNDRFLMPLNKIETEHDYYASRIITNKDTHALKINMHIEVPRNVWTAWDHKGCQLHDYHASYSYTINPENTSCYKLYEQMAPNGKHILENGNFEITMIPLFDKIQVSNADNLMPFDQQDAVKVRTNAGFKAREYHWQYSYNLATWYDFPKAVNYRPTLSVEPSTFMSFDQFLQLVEKSQNFYIRLIPYCSKATIQYLVLKPIIVAPHITKVEATPPSCFQSANGYIKIKFDRPLYADETISLDIQGSNYTNQVFNITQLDKDTAYTWLANLKGDNYQLKLLNGKYKGRVLYTDGVLHKHQLKIDEPSNYSFEAQADLIYCHQANNGRIRIHNLPETNSPFTIVLQHDNKKEEITIPTNTTDYTIDQLQPGNYTTAIYNHQGCYALILKNEHYDIEQKELTITEPNAPVAIIAHQIEHPRGYGRTDGKLTINATGGSPNQSTASGYSVSYKNLTNSQQYQGQFSNNDNNHYYYFVDHIPAGEYEVMVHDQYYLPNNNIPATVAGCITKDTFTLIAPDAIVINIDTTNPISCKHQQDGQLTAHIRGGVPFAYPNLPYHYLWRKIEKQQDSITYDHIKDSTLPNLPTGYYRLTITDANDIVGQTNLIHLAEPDSLTIETTISPVTCFSGQDGIITAIVKGGTLPYRYKWWPNIEETTNIAKGLIQDEYLLEVNDHHHCQNMVAVVLPTPENLTMKTDLQDPTCYDSASGSICLHLIGATPPYQYKWDNGVNDSIVENLKAGIYEVAIQDAHGCQFIKRYQLNNPEQLKLSLGNDRCLCSGQNLALDITLPNHQITYNWTSNNGFTASVPQVKLTKAGTYIATITNEHQCTIKDTITISESVLNIAADYLAATTAFKDQSVYLINISNPHPDSLHWIIQKQDPIKLINSDEHQAELIFTDTGVYTIGLQTYLGNCTAWYERTIHIVEGADFHTPTALNTFAINNMQIYPNPSHGKFNVKVMLNSVGNVRVRMINLSTHQTIVDIQESGSKSYDIPIQASVATGSYYVLVESNSQSLGHQIIIL